MVFSFIIVLHLTVTMELLVTWDRSMVFSFIIVLHFTVTMELLVT